MKKILFLFHLPPPVHGSSVVGAQIHGSKCIQDSFESPWINLLASEEVSGSGKITVGKVFGAFSGLSGLLAQILSRSRLDFCYFALTASGAAFMRDALYVALLKLFAVPVVFHLHNKGFGSEVGFVRMFLYRFVFNGAKVILLSERLFEDVSDYVNRMDVFICPNGIEGPKIRHERDESRSGKTRMLFLSNLIASKGVLVLLEACKLLTSRGLSFNCSLVGGEGDILETTINNFIKVNGLQDSVAYLGKKYGEEKNQIFAESDIFVFPTFYNMETFGLVLLEAMAAGLPCVSTEEGGIPDLVLNGVTGLIVTKRNPQDLADKLELLINNAEMRQSMGETGRKHYEANYTLQKFEGRMLEILKTCIKGARSNENLLV